VHTPTEDFPLKVAEPTAEWHLPDREQITASPKENLWQRLLAWVFLATGFAFYLFSRTTIDTEIAFTVATSQGVFLMSVSQGLLFYLYRKQSNHVEVGTGFRRLQSKVPPQADLPVRVEIVRSGTMTGRDKGYIWLEEGTWYFKGLQTAFRFNQQDVVPIEAWPRSIAPDPANEKPPHVLPMKSVSGPFVLKIDVINPYEDYAKRKKVKGFYREMYDWLTERPRGQIESLLPPTAVHPSLLNRGLSRFEGLAAAAFMVALDSAVLGSLPREGTTTNLGNFGILVAVFVTCMLSLSVRFAWLEFHDLIVRARLSRQPLNPEP
jgi:hypothetical protein